MGAKVQTRATSPVSPPEASEPNWVERLEKLARLCRSTHVRVSRSKLLKLCLMDRLIVRMLKQLDEGDSFEARRHLREYLELRDADAFTDGPRKIEVTEE